MYDDGNRGYKLFVYFFSVTEIYSEFGLIRIYLTAI